MNAPASLIDDEIAKVLAYHGGDAQAAIKALLEDREFLLREVEIASLAVSYGYTRGWKPGRPR
ncbi:hypothetical protein DUT91_21800 [Phyllobacterium salinisoli]|uniref:Uncharacterized protein n=1 Tax=Phyllobacterium salinisoli TaxID=1899321 RepID=A0A368JZG6_9HYPH|nr:CUE domain-containing protein [Phyllobacterium salinisoli]RCS21815.1 hypothetical protein DUT91_21800 [Phyllobacterium salinisoli]